MEPVYANLDVPMIAVVGSQIPIEGSLIDLPGSP